MKTCDWRRLGIISVQNEEQERQRNLRLTQASSYLVREDRIQEEIKLSGVDMISAKIWDKRDVSNSL
jgi:hypothetical protein